MKGAIPPPPPSKSAYYANLAKQGLLIPKPGSYSPPHGARDSCSDTDSGIIADSSSENSQFSPKRLSPGKLNLQLPPPKYGVQRSNHLKPLPPYPSSGSNGAPLKLRRAPLLPHTPTTESLQRKLTDSPPLPPPPHPLQDLQTQTQVRKPQPLRVRFADEVAQNCHDYGARSPNHTPEIPDRPMLRPEMSDRPRPDVPDSARRPGRPIQKVQPMPNRSYYYYTDGSSDKINQSPEDEKPQPPPYNAALERLKDLREEKTSLTSRVEIVPITARSRSASLPRFKKGANRLVDNYMNYSDFDDIVLHDSSLKPAKSMDNLTVKQRRNELRNVNNPCVAPSESFDDILHIGTDEVPQRSRHRKRTDSAKLSRYVSNVKRMASSALQRFSSDESLQAKPSTRSRSSHRADTHKQLTTSISSNFDVLNRKLKIRLLGLDCHGVQVFEFEKLEPGPFGFFIANGFDNRKRGTFISRVNAKCLTPLLTVGDQILSIDEHSVRGKSIEQVQSLIANKQKIVMRVLPVIMR